MDHGQQWGLRGLLFGDRLGIGCTRGMVDVWGIQGGMRGMVRDSGCMVVVNRVCALFIWYRVCKRVMRGMVWDRGHKRVMNS